MPKPTVLSDRQVSEALEQLPGWSGNHEEIRRTAECSTFPAAIAVVDAVAVEAEAADHHPDIDIRWRTLHFMLATHDSGGVTELDLALARKIDAAVAAHG
jgi:4a-hydroxytetrahydrobiopterin dehydratase